MKTTSKTGLKTFANSLGYVGRNFKNVTAWTGKIMFDASVAFMDKPIAQITGYAVSWGSEKLMGWSSEKFLVA